MAKRLAKRCNGFAIRSLLAEINSWPYPPGRWGHVFRFLVIVTLVKLTLAAVFGIALFVAMLLGAI